MNGKTIKALPLDRLQPIVKEYLCSLVPSRVERELQLKYPIEAMLPLSQKLMVSSLMFLLVSRFPLLLVFDPSSHPLPGWDGQLKQCYQGEL